MTLHSNYKIEPWVVVAFHMGPCLTTIAAMLWFYIHIHQLGINRHNTGFVLHNLLTRVFVFHSSLTIWFSGEGYTAGCTFFITLHCNHLYFIGHIWYKTRPGARGYTVKCIGCWLRYAFPLVCKNHFVSNSRSGGCCKSVGNTALHYVRGLQTAGRLNTCGDPWGHKDKEEESVVRDRAYDTTYVHIDRHIK